MLAIFAVAGLWRFTPPPRALAEAAAGPASVHIQTGKAMAELISGERPAMDFRFLGEGAARQGADPLSIAARA